MASCSLVSQVINSTVSGRVLAVRSAISFANSSTSVAIRFGIVATPFKIALELANQDDEVHCLGSAQAVLAKQFGRRDIAPRCFLDYRPDHALELVGGEDGEESPTKGRGTACMGVASS